MDLWMLVVIGFITTFVGTLAGSGGLIGMPSMLLVGLPIHSAIATAKFSNTLSSFSSFYFLLKNKQISFSSALKTAPFALGGGITGGILANSISEETMTIMAIFLLSLALVLALIRKPIEKDSADLMKIDKKIFPYLFGIGIYDGMFGPGQSTLLMYTYLHKGFTYLKAMAFTRFQTFLSCFGSFFLFLSAGHFNIQVGLSYALGAIIGAQLAVRVAKRMKVLYLKRLLHIVTVILIVQLTLKVVL
ncbi:sulfite exporter TauE/SafE family protein [Bacillus sp. 31A1R]|uniref:Probable membrane transporter protein n=1 Tax=Robertmurraya mangrovi TaxID=3098077 RepID=A0ABU5ITZ2_9BACI|nr:sulfite exporter TauE/SafE family protein [Bacillus sp. 31A1R]MDZ5470607.1 sulfite exporter TauE/SafE family protein [Bacillus sp. 31A1R]